MCHRRFRGFDITQRARMRRPVAWVAAAALLGVLASAGCSLLSRPDLAAQIAAARTPAEHAAIVRSLLAQADEYARSAAYHRSLAAKYETLAGPGAQYRSYDRSDLRMAEHCRKVADDLERAASDLRALAHEHEELAHSLEGEQQ